MAAEAEVQSFLDKAGDMAASAYKAVMAGGELQAAWRQGLGELGNALQAFPSSLAHEEPGAIWSPLHSDIADGLKDYRTPAVTPADLVERPAAEQQQGQSLSQQQSHGISV